MAEELKHHRWDLFGPKRSKAHTKYPWWEWLNGSPWLLIYKEDFDNDVRDFQQYVYTYCRNWNIRVRTKIASNGLDLYIQAIGGLPYGPNAAHYKKRHFEAMRKNRRYHETGNKRDKLYDYRGKHDYEEREGKDVPPLR